MDINGYRIDNKILLLKKRLALIRYKYCTFQYIQSRHIYYGMHAPKMRVFVHLELHKSATTKPSNSLLVHLQSDMSKALT